MKTTCRYKKHLHGYQGASRARGPLAIDLAYQEIISHENLNTDIDNVLTSRSASDVSTRSSEDTVQKETLIMEKTVQGPEQPPVFGDQLKDVKHHSADASELRRSGGTQATSKMSGLVVKGYAYRHGMKKSIDFMGPGLYEGPRMIDSCPGLPDRYADMQHSHGDGLLLPDFFSNEAGQKPPVGASIDDYLALRGIGFDSKSLNLLKAILQGPEASAATDGGATSESSPHSLEPVHDSTPSLRNSYDAATDAFKNRGNSRESAPDGDELPPVMAGSKTYAGRAAGQNPPTNYSSKHSSSVSMNSHRPAASAAQPAPQPIRVANKRNVKNNLKTLQLGSKTSGQSGQKPVPNDSEERPDAGLKQNSTEKTGETSLVLPRSSSSSTTSTCLDDAISVADQRQTCDDPKDAAKLSESNNNSATDAQSPRQEVDASAVVLTVPNGNLTQEGVASRDVPTTYKDVATSPLSSINTTLPDAPAAGLPDPPRDVIPGHSSNNSHKRLALSGLGNIFSKLFRCFGPTPSSPSGVPAQLSHDECPSPAVTPMATIFLSSPTSTEKTLVSPLSSQPPPRCAGPRVVLRPMELAGTRQAKGADVKGVKDPLPSHGTSNGGASDLADPVRQAKEKGDEGSWNAFRSGDVQGNYTVSGPTEPPMQRSAPDPRGPTPSSNGYLPQMTNAAPIDAQSPTSKHNVPGVSAEEDDGLRRGQQTSLNFSASGPSGQDNFTKRNDLRNAEAAPRDKPPGASSGQSTSSSPETPGLAADQQCPPFENPPVNGQKPVTSHAVNDFLYKAPVGVDHSSSADYMMATGGTRPVSNAARLLPDRGNQGRVASYGQLHLAQAQTINSSPEGKVSGPGDESKAPPHSTGPSSGQVSNVPSFSRLSEEASGPAQGRHPDGGAVGRGPSGSGPAQLVVAVVGEQSTAGKSDPAGRSLMSPARKPVAALTGGKNGSSLDPRIPEPLFDSLPLALAVEDEKPLKETLQWKRAAVEKESTPFLSSSPRHQQLQRRRQSHPGSHLPSEQGPDEYPSIAPVSGAGDASLSRDAYGAGLAPSLTVQIAGAPVRNHTTLLDHKRPSTGGLLPPGGGGSLNLQAQSEQPLRARASRRAGLRKQLRGSCDDVTLLKSTEQAVKPQLAVGSQTYAKSGLPGRTPGKVQASGVAEAKPQAPLASLVMALLDGTLELEAISGRVNGKKKKLLPAEEAAATALTSSFTPANAKAQGKDATQLETPDAPNGPAAASSFSPRQPPRESVVTRDRGEVAHSRVDVSTLPPADPAGPGGPPLKAEVGTKQQAPRADPTTPSTVSTSLAAKGSAPLSLPHTSGGASDATAKRAAAGSKPGKVPYGKPSSTSPTSAAAPKGKAAASPTYSTSSYSLAMANRTAFLSANSPGGEVPVLTDKFRPRKVSPRNPSAAQPLTPPCPRTYFDLSKYCATQQTWVGDSPVPGFFMPVAPAPVRTPVSAGASCSSSQGTPGSKRDLLTPPGNVVRRPESWQNVSLDDYESSLSSFHEFLDAEAVAVQEAMSSMEPHHVLGVTQLPLSLRKGALSPAPALRAPLASLSSSSNPNPDSAVAPAPATAVATNTFLRPWQTPPGDLTSGSFSSRFSNSTGSLPLKRHSTPHSALLAAGQDRASAGGAGILAATDFSQAIERPSVSAPGAEDAAASRALRLYGDSVTGQCSPVDIDDDALLIPVMMRLERQGSLSALVPALPACSVHATARSGPFFNLDRAPSYSDLEWNKAARSGSSSTVAAGESAAPVREKSPGPGQPQAGMERRREGGQDETRRRRSFGWDPTPPPEMGRRKEREARGYVSNFLNSRMNNSNCAAAGAAAGGARRSSCRHSEEETSRPAVRRGDAPSPHSDHGGGGGGGVALSAGCGSCDASRRSSHSGSDQAASVAAAIDSILDDIVREIISEGEEP